MSPRELTEGERRAPDQKEDALHQWQKGELTWKKDVEGDIRLQFIGKESASRELKYEGQVEYVKVNTQSGFRCYDKSFYTVYSEISPWSKGCFHRAEGSDAVFHC